MTKIYIIIDKTLNKLVGTTCDMINSVENARKYHETTKNQTTIYSAKLVGEFQKRELEI